LLPSQFNIVGTATPQAAAHDYVILTISICQIDHGTEQSIRGFTGTVGNALSRLSASATPHFFCGAPFAVVVFGVAFSPVGALGVCALVDAELFACRMRIG
jgi:hypothetical protein